MKSILVIIVFFTSINFHSQNKLRFVEAEESQSTSLVKSIIQQIVVKDNAIDSLYWYKGEDSMGFFEKLTKFKNDIINSENSIDYYIEKDVFDSGNTQYSVHFYLIEGEEQHSKIYFLFTTSSKEITKLKIDDKNIIQEMKDEWHVQVGKDIPPPLPPSED
jgi:hypothetical protein